MSGEQQREQQALQLYKNIHSVISSDAVSKQIANALPTFLTPERFIRVSLTAIQKTPKLLECDQRSIIGSLVQAAELGLEVNSPLGHAYLIPYWNKNTKRNEAQLQIGYRGFIALARRSGAVSSIAAEIVYQNDVFELSFGTHRQIVHRPNLNPAMRGERIGVYATVVFKDGYTDFEYMTAEDVAAIRSRSKSGDSGPWKTDENEMWRKTPIRRLSKRLPLSIEDADLLTKAGVIDEYNDMGFGETLLPPAPPMPDAPATITEAQRTALATLAQEKGVVEKLGDIIKSCGFELLANITVDSYDEVVAAINEAAAPENGAANTSDDGDAIDGEVVEETPAAPVSKADKQAAKRLEYIERMQEMAKEDPDKAKEIEKLLDGRKWEDLNVIQVKDIYAEVTK